MLAGQVLPRDRHVDLTFFAEGKQGLSVLARAGHGEGLETSILNGEAGVGNHLIFVYREDVTETVALGAGANGVREVKKFRCDGWQTETALRAGVFVGNSYFAPFDG